LRAPEALLEDRNIQRTGFSANFDAPCQIVPNRSANESIVIDDEHGRNDIHQ
jgi:hypothetical protein